MFSRISATWRDRIAGVMVAVALLAPLRGLLHYQGPPMEEGFMLTFPEQILHGRYPHRDFLHLYGPGSLWLLAGIYKVLGVTLTVERMVGFAQHLVVAFAIFALLRPWGRRVAAAGSVTAVLVLITPLGLSAMAWNGALAFGLSGLAVGIHAARRDDDSGLGLALACGVLAGITLLYRPDLVVAVVLGFGAIWFGVGRRKRVRILIGAGGTLALYIPHLLLAGPSAAIKGMITQPVFDLRGGRSLPIPPSFSHLDGYLQRAGGVRVVMWPFSTRLIAPEVSLWFWLVVAATVYLIVVGWLTTRRWHTARASRLLPPTLFGATLITQAVQRPDTAHLSWVTGVTFPLVIAATAEVLSHHRPKVRGRSWWAIAPVAVILVIIIPFYPLRTYLDLVGQSFGHDVFGYAITRGDRTFYYGDANLAHEAQDVTNRLAQDLRPGQKLIVGPYDLSKTPYSDAFFYYLFPDLTPGTRYIEMDPGIADAPGSGLAHELARSDWLIQSDVWSGWDEPNDSRFAGSQAPNRVVADHYCTVLDAKKFRLMHRCR